MLALLYCLVAVAAVDPSGAELLPAPVVRAVDPRSSQELRRIRAEQARSLELLRKDMDERFDLAVRGWLQYKQEVERELEDLRAQIALQRRVLWTTLVVTAAWIAYFSFRLWQRQRPQRRSAERAIRGLPLAPSADG